MNDLNLSSIASSLGIIADEIGTLTCIEDEISGVREEIKDLKSSIDYLTDIIEGIKNE